ncbi:hypothetical protein EVAR_79395_1 [Eumeta japonica]|uniref:Uncharacterized protein n=1 Tax=Eumeta variegata TaxID=151549 RepID=A0A4C1VGJ6_EUMVA|nr:hypothetical protein EVAR_79395_1 [Eumeta japonica]
MRKELVVPKGVVFEPGDSGFHPGELTDEFLHLRKFQLPTPSLGEHARLSVLVATAPVTAVVIGLRTSLRGSRRAPAAAAFSRRAGVPATVVAVSCRKISIKHVPRTAGLSLFVIDFNSVRVARTRKTLHVRGSFRESGGLRPVTLATAEESPVHYRPLRHAVRDHGAAKASRFRRAMGSHFPRGATWCGVHLSVVYGVKGAAGCAGGHGRGTQGGAGRGWRGRRPRAAPRRHILVVNNTDRSPQRSAMRSISLRLSAAARASVCPSPCHSKHCNPHASRPPPARRAPQLAAAESQHARTARPPPTDVEYASKYWPCSQFQYHVFYINTDSRCVNFIERFHSIGPRGLVRFSHNELYENT